MGIHGDHSPAFPGVPPRCKAELAPGAMDGKFKHKQSAAKPARHATSTNDTTSAGPAPNRGCPRPAGLAPRWKNSCRPLNLLHGRASVRCHRAQKTRREGGAVGSTVSSTMSGRAICCGKGDVGAWKYSLRCGGIFITKTRIGELQRLQGHLKHRFLNGFFIHTRGYFLKNKNCKLASLNRNIWKKGG